MKWKLFSSLPQNNQTHEVYHTKSINMTKNINQYQNNGTVIFNKFKHKNTKNMVQNWIRKNDGHEQTIYDTICDFKRIVVAWHC